MSDLVIGALSGQGTRLPVFTWLYALPPLAIFRVLGAYIQSKGPMKGRHVQEMLVQRKRRPKFA